MKRLQDNSDAPEARLGTLPKTYASFKRKTRLHSIHPRRNGYQESLWWIQEQLCTMVNKKDFNSGDHEDIEESDDGDDGQRRCKQREEATAYVKRLDLFVTVMFLGGTPQFFLSRIKDIPTIGPAVKNHISPKRAREVIAIFQTMCHS